MRSFFRPEERLFPLLFHAAIRTIERRIVRIEVPGIQMILRNTKSIAESLIVCDLSCAEEFDRLSDVGIVDEAKNVVVRCTRFLLSCNRVYTTCRQKLQ